MTVPKEGICLCPQSPSGDNARTERGMSFQVLCRPETVYQGSSGGSPPRPWANHALQATASAEVTQALGVYFRVTGFSVHAAGLGMRE